MDSLSAQKKSPDEVASYWRIRLSDPRASNEDVAEFERWRAASPAHEAAYLAMDRAWNAAGAEAGTPEMLAIRATALRYQPPKHRRPWRSLAAAAAIVLAVSAGLWVYRTEWAPWTSGPTHFETQVGQRSTLRLKDTSLITLNTASRLETQFDSHTRAVRLLAGQAIFEIAKDPHRPFVVYAGDRKITALGTAFDVRIDSREVRVILVEGKVAVEQLIAKPTARASLAPGEQLVAVVGGASTVQSTDIEQAISWREGRLIFKAERLAEAVAEMNRYSEAPLVLEDAAAGDLRLSGVFRTGDPAAFARALTEYFPLEAEARGNATLLRWRDR